MTDHPTILTCSLCGHLVVENTENGLAIESRVHITTDHPEHGAGVAFIEWRPTIHDTPRAGIFGELDTERERQQTLHYDLTHDDEHGLDHMLSLAGNYAAAATTEPTAEVADQRRALIKCAALVVAAIELLDRSAAQ